ncbi:DUF3455 domain-containing protein [Piscinibacter terrae]|uniref:DUF3455 domain-containing protein n=1 Tax=Piscinibacter terrae TaxID=2496871 RepID=A0A3N7JV48_9BURK|nr:DUF3455 domain-containing protein [Albitalea terrae]RQP24759.1 DUF3455 domain-containing protein [Albitalea terrae]
MKRPIAIACLHIFLCGCASQPPASPEVAVPDQLRPDATQSAFTTLAARGVQIYECRTKKDNPGAAEWAFVAPEAQLYDANGKLVGKHYAGPHWESTDGSKIVGSVTARANAPQAGAIPWLLLSTKSDGPSGVFAKVTSIQRVSTMGGAAPAEGCSGTSLGKTARVVYSADYVLFAQR